MADRSFHIGIKRAFKRARQNISFRFSRHIVSRHLLAGVLGEAEVTGDKLG